MMFWPIPHYYFRLKMTGAENHSVSVFSGLLKGSLHLWKDECVFKMGNLCRKNVKLFLN